MSLDPNQEKSISVSVNVPASGENGQIETIKVIATSQNNSNFIDSSEVNVEVFDDPSDSGGGKGGGGCFIEHLEILISV